MRHRPGVRLWVVLLPTAVGNNNSFDIAQSRLPFGRGIGIHTLDHLTIPSFLAVRVLPFVVQRFRVAR